MAGTRLLLQGTILLELLCLVLVSIHIGFCQRRLRPSSGKGLPKLLLTEDYFQTDPVLCPWDYVPLLVYKDHKLQEVVGESTPRPQHKLRNILVLEDSSQLLDWATIVEKEWKVPSYLLNLESIQIDQPWEIYSVPPMDESMVKDGRIPMEALQSLWNHLYTSKIPNLDTQKDASLMILYVPQILESKKNPNKSESEESNETSPVEKDPLPAILSYQLQLLTRDSKKSSSGPFLLIPTTQETNGLLGSYVEEWMVQSIVGEGQSPTHDTTTAFWNLLQAQWQQQTLRLHRHLSSIPSAKPNLNNLVLPLQDPSMTDIPALQMSIAQWQSVYGSLQSLLLFHTGRTSIPVPTPPPLTQVFPLEHYAAILMPLLFPLLVPFVVATFKEYKRWKEKISKTEDSVKEKAA
jgi:Phosphatidylinositol-glycan biosynthesis class S protein